MMTMLGLWPAMMCRIKSFFSHALQTPAEVGRERYPSAGSSGHHEEMSKLFVDMSLKSSCRDKF